MVAHSIANKPTRRFLIPHFELDQVVQQPRETVLLDEGSRVKVYVDLCIGPDKSETSPHLHLYDNARQVCTIIEGELLPLIERWIGRISDLDGDQHLSVVLTDLDRRQSFDDTPVLGCVRRSDFSAEDQNPLAGDIVYLDRHLPPRQQLRALLAHELTHAAIYCIRHEAPEGSALQNHSVPAWLNEAAAHWVEQRFCQTPEGYATRAAAFRRSPALCPIILKDDDSRQPARRSGSRVAGFTFLQQHLADVSELRELLEQHEPFEQSISSVAETPFSRLFRLWTINQATENHEECLPLQLSANDSSLKMVDTGPVRRKLHGTAFLTLYSDADRCIFIEAHPDTRLQITVLYPVTPTINQNSTRISTVSVLQTADRTTPSHSAIQ